MIEARPHINGNTEDDFRKHAADLYAASLKMENALVAVRATCLHGRNYQHMSGPEAEACRKEDLDRLEELMVVLRSQRRYALELDTITRS